MTLRDLITKHEGEILHLYRDTKGKLTGGVGHNYDDDGVSRAVSQFQLDDDIARIRAECAELYDWFRTLGTDNLVRQDAIVDMAFMGPKKLGNFVKMIAAIRAEDWLETHDQILNSEWRRDVGDSRAMDIAEMMLTGEYPS